MRIAAGDRVYTTKLSILSQDDFWEDDEHLHMRSSSSQPVLAYQWYNADDDSSSIDYDEEYNY